ncbi:MAG: hypothetical protein ACKVPX_02175 [Myxococcaceae bacterium]
MNSRLIVGALLSGLLSALAFMGQVGPRDAVSNLSKWVALLSITPPDWLKAPSADKWLGWTAGVLFLLFLLAYIRPKRRRKRPEFIPLREAANIAYERLRDADSIYATASEELGHTGKDESRSEGILSWFAYCIGPKVELYGKHPPSRLKEHIPRDELKRCSFIDGANAMKYYEDREARYTDLEVRADELERVIAQLKDARISDPADEFVPVRDAIVMVNDRLYDTEWGTMFRGWGQDENETDRITIGARMLSSEIPLYGKEPLSETRRPIPVESIDVTMADWLKDGDTIRKMNTKAVLYSGLAFKRADLEALIERVRSGS